MKIYKHNLIWSYFRIKSEIKKNVGKEISKEIMIRFKEEYRKIDTSTKQEKGIMSFHRMFLLLGLALYNSLQEKLQNKEKVIDIIHEILWNGRMNKNIRFLAFFVRRSKDPFKTYLKLLGPNNVWFFPCPPWEKESVEIENGIGWHQKKCPYMNFFENEGIWELTKAYGDMDLRIAELFPKHIELKREKALCKGDDLCDFLYYRN